MIRFGRSSGQPMGIVFSASWRMQMDLRLRLTLLIAVPSTPSVEIENNGGSPGLQLLGHL